MPRMNQGWMVAQVLCWLIVASHVDAECKVKKTIHPGTPNGQFLYDLTSLVLSGTPEHYEVTSYIADNKKRQMTNNSKFYCDSMAYPDERRFICLERKSGKLILRENSKVSEAKPKNGSKFEIIIKAFSDGHVLLAFCKACFEVTSKNISEGFCEDSPMQIPKLKTTKITTTSPTTRSPTTKRTTSPPKTTSTTKSTTMTSKSTKITSTTNGRSTSLSSTQATTKYGSPCADEGLMKYSLKTHCVAKNKTLLPSAVTNASHVIFKLSGVSDLFSVSHIIIKTSSFNNRTVSIKLYAFIGNLKRLIKNIEAKMAKDGQKIPVASFMPENSTAVALAFSIAGRRVAIASDEVTLGLTTYPSCSPRCTSLYHSWMKIHRQCAKQRVDEPLVQFKICFDMCSSETTTPKDSNFTYMWPRTASGATATTPCEKGEGFATRQCKRGNKKKPVWAKVKDTQCKSAEKQVDEGLEELSNGQISAKNASKAAEELKNITKKNPTSLPPRQLSKITEILEQLSPFAEDEQVAEEMLNTVDNCMEASEESFLRASKSNNMSSRMVAVLSTVGEAMVEKKSVYKVIKQGFALAASKQNKTSFRGMTFSYQSSSSKGYDLSMETGVKDTTAESSTSIALPQDLLSSSKDEVQKIVFVAYNDGKLFLEKGTSRLNSKVVSAQVVNNKISGLRRPIVTKFKTNNQSTQQNVCAWWDFSLKGGVGGWTMSGCNMFKSENGYTTCHCNHLTNFAVLFGGDMQMKPPSHQLALSVISYVGVAVSLAGVLFTLFSYTIFPKLRENCPPKILMNLCAAIALLLVIYAAGIERTTPRGGCQAVAFLLQYAVLCVLAWSAVEGFHSYRGIVKPMKSEVPKMMRKAAVIGWGVPLIFPTIGMAAWHDEYGDGNSCAVKGLPLYATLVAPVGIVMVLNICAIVSILFALNQSSKMYSHHAIKMLHRIRIIVAFVLLFSLTWFFGFLVIANQVLAFEYTFCILNSLQGFFIFLFYCVRNENVRKSWKEKIGMTAQRRMTSSSGTKKTESIDSEDRAMYNRIECLKSDTLVRTGSTDSSTKIVLANRAHIYATS